MSASQYARYGLKQSPFYKLSTKRKLFQLLYTDKKKLNELLSANDIYSRRTTENGRLIEEPKYRLKELQKRIEDLLKRVCIPDFVYAPAKKKSYISNAAAHREALEVRCLDITAYFQSTSSKRVYWFFHKEMRCSPDVAGILTRILTLEQRLPTGSPSSPIISYFAHLDMWAKIYELASSYQCTLTVYMDDVTISGESVPKVAVAEIKGVLNRYGLRSKASKEKHYRFAKAIEITGVIIKRDGRLCIPSRQHRKVYVLRKRLTHEKNELSQFTLLRKLEGHEMQRQQVESFDLDVVKPQPQ